MHTIARILNQAELTKTEDLIRKYILNHGIEICFMTSTDLALATGVSEATVIRFTRKLGYSGYMTFQKQLQAGYQKAHNRIPESVTVPYERLVKSMEHGEDDFLSEYAMNAQKNVHSAIANNSREMYLEAIDTIVGSEKKYLLGSRANYGLATYCYFLFNCMLPGVQMANNPAASVVDNLSGITEKDCMVAFSFPRYSKLDQLAVDMAHHVGAKLIVITDHPTSPLTIGSSMVFTVEVSSAFFFNSFIGVQHVLETLCAGVSRRIGRSNEEKLRNIDKYLDVIQLY